MARLLDSEQIVAGLHEAYFKRVYFFALRELRAHACAEDAASETISRVMQAVRDGRVATADSVPRFVAGTMRNVIHEQRRATARESAMDGVDAAGPEAVFVDPSVRTAIERVLDRLKPRERDLLRLYY